MDKTKRIDLKLKRKFYILGILYSLSFHLTLWSILCLCFSNLPHFMNPFDGFIAFGILTLLFGIPLIRMLLKGR